jgi:predicted aspartyl protease
MAQGTIESRAIVERTEKNQMKNRTQLQAEQGTTMNAATKTLTATFAGRVNLLRIQCQVAAAFDPRGEGKSFENFNAVFDTGAVISVINRRVVNALKLKSVGKWPVQTTNGVIQQSVYLVNILLPSGALFWRTLVNCSDFGATEVDALIGMDIITSGQLIVMPHEGETLMSFTCPASTNILAACHGLEIRDPESSKPH